MYPSAECKYFSKISWTQMMSVSCIPPTLCKYIWIISSNNSCNCLNFYLSSAISKFVWSLFKSTSRWLMQALCLTGWNAFTVVLILTVVAPFVTSTCSSDITPILCEKSYSQVMFLKIATIGVLEFCSVWLKIRTLAKYTPWKMKGSVQSLKFFSIFLDMLSNSSPFSPSSTHLVAFSTATEEESGQTLSLFSLSFLSDVENFERYQN